MWVNVGFSDDGVEDSLIGEDVLAFAFVELESVLLVFIGFVVVVVDVRFIG